MPEVFDQETKPARVLILGGTAEAVQLAQTLHQKGGVEIITSLAGRTTHPDLATLYQYGAVRIGGFGGVEKLVDFLKAEQITCLYDATHPFALRISHNAKLAASALNIKLVVHTRVPWVKEPDDLWIEVKTVESAISAIPPKARVFLALGRQYIAPFAQRTDCHFVIRMVETPEQPLPFADYQLILAKAQADAEREHALLEAHKISVIVARNSGGQQSYGKILAARALGLPVIMIGRA